MGLLCKLGRSYLGWLTSAGIESHIGMPSHHYRQIEGNLPILAC